MDKVKQSGADLLYFGGLVDSGGPQLLKDLKAVAPEITFMGPDGIQTKAFIDAAGADVAAGTLATVAGKAYADLTGAGAEFYTNFKAAKQPRTRPLRSLRLRGDERRAQRHRRGWGQGPRGYP